MTSVHAYTRRGDTATTAAALQRAVLRRASTLEFYDVNCEAYADATLALDTSGAIDRFAALVPHGGKVLDAGCGSGRDLMRLRDAGLSPVGLDISVKLVEIARRNADLPVVQGDLRSPPFPPSSFDGIWAMASLLHLEQDEVRPALRALAATLRPGGVLFTSVKTGRGRVRDADGRWFTLHDESAWAAHMQATGFDVVEMVRETADVQGPGTVKPGWISSLAIRVG